MISTDRGIFEENSEARRRMIEYGGLAGELHIIIFAKRHLPRATLGKRQGLPLADFSEQISDNVFLYPTNSLSRCLYIFDAIKIGKTIIRNSCDKILVSCQDPFETGLAGYFIAKRGRLPFQLQIHTNFLSPYFKKDSFLNRSRVILAKFLIPRASCVRVVSQRIKNSLRAISYQLSAISILPIFVDIEKIKSAPVKVGLREKYPQFDFIILMASRLTKEKNIGMAIEAMREIIKKHPKTGLIIVGSGPEREELKSSVVSRQLSANIIFENWTDDLSSYYKTADLFLLTSNYEGYGRTVIEAMAANCPVIMADVGLAREFVKNYYNGIIVSVGGKKETEEAILKIISDGELRATLIRNAAETAAAFPNKAEYLRKYKESWENCAL